MNTFNYRVSTVVGGSPTINAFAADFLVSAQWAINESTFRACCPNNYTHLQTWLQFVRPVRYVAFKDEVNVAGDSGAAALTANLAAVVTRQGDIADKHNNGSIHIPIAQDDTLIANGKLTAGFKTTVNAFAENVNDGITVTSGAATVTTRPVLYFITPSGSVNSRDVITAYAQDTVRVMRRRTVGLGI
jgi:hypothetical protein